MTFFRRALPLFTRWNILGALVALLFVHSFVILVLSWNAPIIDMYAFRQTQTALTAYWMLENGFSLSYETPVVGAPWAVPFEFPLYQVLVAQMSQIGVSLDPAGRVVSYVFFIACLWPLYSLSRDLKLGNFWFLATAALFLASPIYLFWGRSFMIETTALFFAMGHLSVLVAFLCRGGWFRVVLGAIFGILAVLAKSTTLPAFSLMAGIFALYHFAPGILATRRLGKPGIWGSFGAALLVPYPVGFAWVAFTDAVKSQNMVGRALTSEALKTWNYGSIADRLSERFWSDTLLLRTMPDILGVTGTFALLLFLALQVFPKIHVGLSGRQAVLLGLAITGFFLPLMLFTNLHIVHNYYQAANAVFLLAAVGVLAAGFETSERPRAATAAVLVLVVSQLAYFYADYFGKAVAPHLSPQYTIALAAHELTPENSGLMVFGADWDSTIAYYSQRKTFSAPDWIDMERVENAIADPVTTLGGLDLGGIVVCRYRDLAFQTVVEQLVDGREVLSQADLCTLYDGSAMK